MVVTAIASPSEDAGYLNDRAEALERLRSARRRNRIANVDKFDAFYKAYVGAIVGGGSIYWAAGMLGDQTLSADAMDTAVDLGPLVAGVVAALAVAIGLRSGARGGPLAFEGADIRHVLLAPVDRRDSIRSSATKSLRHSIFLGATVGAVAGVLASRRVAVDPPLWVVSFAVFGAFAAALAYGAALVSGGLRLPSWLADVLSVVALGWAGADVFIGLPTSPFSWLGEVIVTPSEPTVWAPLGLVVAIAVALAGRLAVDGISVEAADRRSRLVGQLRFAATVQDVRAVMLIQRQLSQQHPRQRPWLRLGVRRPGSKAGVWVFVRRCLHGYMRWPFSRFVRLLLLVAIAALAVTGVWHGTSPLIVVAGLALWLAALDLCEPLAQEADHGDRTATTPVEQGVMHARLLVAPAVVLLILVALGSIPLLVAAPSPVGAALLPLIGPVTILAIGGAAIVVSRPPSIGSSVGDLMPEVAGLKLAVKVVLPPALAVFGFLPVALAREAWTETQTAAAVSESISVVSAAMLAFAFWSILWIRYSESLKQKFIEAGANAVAGAEEKAKAKP